MIELKVEGMSCNHCVHAVTRAVKSVDPGAEVRVDLEGGTVSVDGQGTAEALSRAIRAAGYSTSPADAADVGR